MLRCRLKLWPLLLAVGPVAGIDNGLARTPPLGWRSWNLYYDHVDQTLMMRSMEGLVSRGRLVDGKPTSLCDLGYCDIGLDDAWQACGKGSGGYQYHAQDSNGDWFPVVNTTRFPDMKAMTDKAHSLGLTAGWYHNNCICAETQNVTAEVYAGDVKALLAYGYDAVKLDGCGTEYDLDLWWRLLNETGKAILIENCHWGKTVPNSTWCPWNFFRTTVDMTHSYASVVGNLQSTIQWAKNGISSPGCWAQPGGLEVGCGGLTSAETRAHFGAWAVISAPLILSMDLSDVSLMDELWPLIANPDILAVNQAWAGHSGSPFQESLTNVSLSSDLSVPSWQYFQKPLGDGRVAVLLMNHASSEQQLTLHLADVPGLSCSTCSVYDLFTREDRGPHSELTELVASHDAAFFVLSNAPGPHAEVIVA